MRYEQHPDLRGEGEKHKSAERTGLAQQQNGATPHAVGPLAENRTGDELADGIAGDQSADDGRRGTEAFRVKRQQGQNDREPEDIDGDDQKYGQQGRPGSPDRVRRGSI
jgi:hypothetical protein